MRLRTRTALLIIAIVIFVVVGLVFAYVSIDLSEVKLFIH